MQTKVVTYTRAAFLPHITPSLALHITSPLTSPQSNVLITLEHMLSITTPSTNPSPLKQTHAHISDSKLFISAADICSGGDNTVTVEEARLTLNKAVVLLLPNRQQYRVGAEEYIDACLSAGADVCIALNDYQSYQESGEKEKSKEADKGVSVKRVKIDGQAKSVSEADLKRNMRFLVAQLTHLKATDTSMQLYARVYGGEDLIPKLNAALILEECDGYVIKIPTHTSFTEHLSTLPACVRVALEDKSETRKAVWVYGIRSAKALYEAAEHGVAFIDDSWAYNATRLNHSIDLVPYFSSVMESLKADKEVECVISVSGGGWKGKMEKLSEGCGCGTCERHTKAYVYHLVERGEISSATLLQVHNMYQIRWFVREVQKGLINSV